MSLSSDTVLVLMRRSYGTGSLYEKSGTWYARWYTAAGRYPHRKVGAARRPGSRDGLTRTQAEAQLRRMIDKDAMAPSRPAGPAPGVEDLAAAFVARLEGLQRKRSHIETVQSHVRVHLAEFFGATPVDAIAEGDLEAFMGWMRRRGASPKTIRNVMGTLHSIFDLALRRKLVATNPCRLVERPRDAGADSDIRFLDQEELEALLRAKPSLEAAQADWDWWWVERVLYLMAAMTGMRMGELRALRWLDLDWSVQKVRVRQSFVRGQFGSPKSKRSSRAIPLAARLVAELDERHRDSLFNADEDLVFANPHTGRPMDRSKVLKRFKAACDRAAVRRVRFHDLRHTFGTRMAASGAVSLRTLQEWMGHRDFKTTLIYADYQPGDQEAQLVDDAFMVRSVEQSEDKSEQPKGGDSQ